MCCCISDEPVEDTKGKIQTFNGANTFQTTMMGVLEKCPGGFLNCCPWFCGQFMPMTCCCTQYCLRRKVLANDMSLYLCCQGYFNCCCFKAGEMGEQSCPDLCLGIESCCCNSLALSASRMYVMNKYDLKSDPCDYRLIRINNCLQALSCICDILAIFIKELREVARILDLIASLVYHCVSGCMTVQVSHEMDYQNQQPLLAPQASEYVEAQYLSKA